MSQMIHYSQVHVLHPIQVKSVCVFLLFYVPVYMMDVPGHCRHSITKDHLLQIRHLINNQLWNGCRITYTFIERKNLSSACYVKVALPRVLDLLSTHFKYTQGSDSAQSVLSLQNLIFNIYSQKCVPGLSEELEEIPVAFLRQFTDSSVQALERAEEVLEIYLQLITQKHTTMDWSCAVDHSTHTSTAIIELPTTTEAKLGILGQNHQDSFGLSFYRPGFIVLAVSGGILLLLTVSCLIHSKSSPYLMFL
ncbi:macrophage colony-stimulating factor 1b [Trichomycterus rosablanca]|uniref:macrophage colony-stimulating factor 1b n=1 Tax=Trichomycterus rosablanca TaxID=2290929 RepID=UPI002F359AD8